jgi:hypothetical protein
LFIQVKLHSILPNSANRWLLLVRVADWGRPMTRASQLSFYVYVKAENDDEPNASDASIITKIDNRHSPIFIDSDLSVSIREDRPIGTVSGMIQ